VASGCALSNNNPLPGTGGVITSATGGTFTSTGGGTFGGILNGNLTFNRSGTTATVLTSAQPYTGATNIRGGILQLRDAGAITASSAVNNYFGTLNMDFSNLNYATAPDRLGNTVPTNLFGATLLLTGAPGVATTETTGTVTLQPGYSTVTATPTGLGTATLTLGNLVRNRRLRGELHRHQSGHRGPWQLPHQSWLAQQQRREHRYLPRGLGARGLNEFAGYSATLGVGPMGSAAFGLYDQTVTSAGTLISLGAAQNAKMTVAGTLVAGGTLVNSLNIAGANTLTFAAATDVLNIVSGGLLKSGGNSNIGSSGTIGVLTSGGLTTNTASQLLLSVPTSAAVTVFSKIVDNGVSGSTTSLVISGLGTVSLAPQVGGTSTYSGSTIINQATVNTTSAAAGVTVIPGTLTINNAPVTMGIAGAIAPNAPINLNGSSTLTLTGANTLNGPITFNNTGGGANPTLTTGGTLTLGSGGITANNDSFSFFPTLSGHSSIWPTTPAPSPPPASPPFPW
jgi:fibronectin-binding autotransporter adhesin